MKHALIRGVLGSDQFICIDGRFGKKRIAEEVKFAVHSRARFLPNFDTFNVDVYRGPRVGEGGLVMTVKVESPYSPRLAL